MLRGEAWLFLLGATVVTVFDGFHTHSGSTEYANPVFAMAAWWTPLLFGSAVLGLGAVYARLHPKLGGPREIASAERLAIGFVVFGCLYFASGYLPASNVVKLAVLVAGAAALALLLDKSSAAWILAIGAAVIGPSFEIGLTHAGGFRHMHPDLWGIPMWLPGLYLAAAFSLGGIARKVLRDDSASP